MYEMQGPRSADLVQTRRLPRRAGPPGQSAIRALVRPPPVQNTCRRPGYPVPQPAPELLPKSSGFPLRPSTELALRSSRFSPDPSGFPPRSPTHRVPPGFPPKFLGSPDSAGVASGFLRVIREARSRLRNSRSLSGLSDPPSGFPGVSPWDSRSCLRAVPVFAGREVVQPLRARAQEGSETNFMIL